jgi:N4-gp56 family major capsid protein
MTNYLTTALAATGGTNVRLSEVVLTIYSKDIMFQAQPVLRFDQFAKVKTDLSATPGKQITFFKYDNLGAGGLLTEGTPLATKALAGSQVSIAVYEYGNAVAVSNMLLVTAFTDVMGDTAKLLGVDYAKVIDALARDTIEGGAGSTVFADNAASVDLIASDDYLTMEEIKDAVEVLATNNSQKIDNDHWVCFVHPHQSRNLRDDADWITVGKLDPQRLYNGEIGRIDDVIFIETTQVSIDANGAATPVDVYSSIMIGDNAFGKAVALPVEMRDNGVVDFGRERDLAWYTICGYGVLNEDNIVKIQTA